MRFLFVRLFGTKTDEEKVKSKRRLEYLIERGDENHCYVKKWLKQSFIPQIQADPSFYSWRNNVRLFFLLDVLVFIA
jgi:hypothetical protein